MKQQLIYFVAFLFVTVSDLSAQTQQDDCSDWYYSTGACLDIEGKPGVTYQVCIIGETQTTVEFKLTLKPSTNGIDRVYKKGIRIVTSSETVNMTIDEFNQNGFETTYSLQKDSETYHWESGKKAFLNKRNNQYVDFHKRNSFYIECSVL